MRILRFFAVFAAQNDGIWRGLATFHSLSALHPANPRGPLLRTNRAKGGKHPMKRLGLLLVCSILALSAFAADTTTPQKSLYQRLGGYDAIAAVTDDFIGRLATDKQVAHFLQGHSKDSLGKIRQLVVDQICAA